MEKRQTRELGDLAGLTPSAVLVGSKARQRLAGTKSSGAWLGCIAGFGCPTWFPCRFSRFRLVLLKQFLCSPVQRNINVQAAPRSRSSARSALSFSDFGRTQAQEDHLRRSPRQGLSKNNRDGSEQKKCCRHPTTLMTTATTTSSEHPRPSEVQQLGSTDERCNPKNC